MSDSMLSGLQRLLKSSKGLVLIAAILAVALLVGFDKVSSADALGFIKWALAAFFGAVAIEDGAEKLGRVSASNQTTNEETKP